MRPLKYRSKLFVHGAEPGTFAPAFATAADSVVLNNEDHVAPDMKAASRMWIREFLATPGATARKLVQVRLNPVGSPEFDVDIEALVVPGVQIINLTKVESPDTILHAAAAIGALERIRGIAEPIGLLITIESPAGLRRAAELARAPRVVGLQIGFGDLLRPLGVDFQGPGADTVRLLVRMAAAEAGVSCFDGAYLGDVADIEGYRHDAERGARFGCTGKSCNSAAQVDVANAVFGRTAQAG